MMEVHLKNDDYKNHMLHDAGQLAKDILASVRKQKTELKLAMNSKIDVLYLTVDKPTGLDWYFRGGAAYDIMGATGAERMVFRSKWGPELDKLEEYCIWDWSNPPPT